MRIMLRGKRKFSFKRLLIHILMIILAIIAIVPLYVVLINATRSTEQIRSGFSFIPGSHSSYNWKVLAKIGSLRIWRGFANSAFISTTATILSVYFSAMTAYGLHIYRFRGRLLVWTIILIIIMLPGSLGFIGFYQQMVKWKWLDSYLPLIIPAIAAAGSVLFIRQYMSAALDKEFIDAARIDGAGEFYIFNILIIPIIVPVLATLSIFTFVGSWNNFFMPFILLSTQDKYTLPMMVALLNREIYNTEYGGIYFGIAISLIPIIIFYAFMSRYIISGLTIGGIKG